MNAYTFDDAIALIDQVIAGAITEVFVLDVTEDERVRLFEYCVQKKGYNGLSVYCKTANVRNDEREMHVMLKHTEEKATGSADVSIRPQSLPRKRPSSTFQGDVLSRRQSCHKRGTSSTSDGDSDSQHQKKSRKYEITEASTNTTHTLQQLRRQVFVETTRAREATSREQAALRRLILQPEEKRRYSGDPEHKDVAGFCNAAVHTTLASIISICVAGIFT